MSTFDLTSPSPTRTPRLAGWLRPAGVGLVYWLAFLLLLEPGNLLRDGGTGLRWDQEVLRILVATFMGASVTPLLVALSNRRPIERPHLLSRTMLHGLAICALAAALIVASCFPAAWLLMRRPLPSFHEVGEQLSANWALLFYCMAAFTAVLHAVRFYRQSLAAPHRVDTRDQVAVTSRGRITLIDLAAVDWIESQGNYLALHAGPATHLVRDTLAAFQTRLDPGAFVRVHRRSIVRVDRLLALRPLASGDALVTLTDGRELRCSRSYRAALASRLNGSRPGPQ